jgi:acetyl esterase/lipase
MVSQQSLVYDPAALYEIEVHEQEYLRHGEEGWLVRIYQPKGSGPFPALLDVHGGAWNRGDRTHSDYRAPQLAATGVVIASVDFRLGPAHPYPAQVADVNYATRWLKAHAGDFNADAASVGLWGASSGGHTIFLSAMRPHDPRYSAIPLDEGAGIDATAKYLIGCWPIVDPHARYFFAQDTHNDRLVASSEAYFLTQDAMQEGNPHLILDRGESVLLPPALIIQGTEDNNLPVPVTRTFAGAYRQAGGSLQLEIFEGMPHSFGSGEGPEADRALELMKEFIAAQVNG